jgi:hypothetical protein
MTYPDVWFRMVNVQASSQVPGSPGERLARRAGCLVPESEARENLRQLP